MTMLQGVGLTKHFPAARGVVGGRGSGWIKAVDGHSAGESDAALRTINDWTYNDLELMRPYVELLVDAQTCRDPMSGELFAYAARAVLDGKEFSGCARVGK